MWFYVDRILIAYQREDAAEHGRPRGNLSDLYPRWLGARELLLRGRNPYSQEITIEIQKGYYGRALDPSSPDDPKDKEAFVYPIYVVFLLAPTVNLPFHIVQAGFRWLLMGFAAISVLLWLRVLQWKLPVAGKILCVILTIGSLPFVQGIKLQQLSLLVAGILAACATCLAGGYLVCGGTLLALATIKPQLAWPLVVWLLLWAGSKWRLRWRFIVGFATTMVLLLAGGEFLLPGWWRMFLSGIRQYHEYTQNQSVLEWLLGSTVGRFMGWLAVAGCGLCVWSARNDVSSSVIFARTFGLVLALTVLIVPMYAPYNQVLLLPAIFSLVRDTTVRSENSRGLLLARSVGALLLFWPWIATMGLSAASFWLTSGRRQSVWTLPFYSTFALPIFIFGISLLATYRSPHRTLSKNPAN